MGKSSINGPFSMAMLNNQRVYISAVIPMNTHFRCATPGPWSRPGIPCCRSSRLALFGNVLIGEKNVEKMDGPNGSGKEGGFS